MSRKSQAQALIIGGEPRVNLLPPEVGQAQRARSVRRAMVGVFFFVVVLVVGAYGFATYLAIESQQRLALENARTDELLAEQAKYVEVRATTDRLATAEAALVVGASTEINLTALLSDVQSKLPAGAVIDTASVDTATPLDAYGQSAAPLQPQRVATLTFTVITPSIPDVRSWLIALEEVVGFTDAVPGTIALQENGDYLSAVTMHVNSDAFSNRFPATEVSQ